MELIVVLPSQKHVRMSVERRLRWFVYIKLRLIIHFYFLLAELPWWIYWCKLLQLIESTLEVMWFKWWMIEVTIFFTTNLQHRLVRIFFKKKGWKILLRNTKKMILTCVGFLCLNLIVSNQIFTHSKIRSFVLIFKLLSQNQNNLIWIVSRICIEIGGYETSATWTLTAHYHLQIFQLDL